MLTLLPCQDGHHQGFTQRLATGARQDRQEAINTVLLGLTSIAPLLLLCAEHLWLQGLPVRTQHGQDVLAGLLENLAEVASAAAQAVKAHPVDTLQDLAVSVLPGAEQLHRLLTHGKLAQAQPGSGSVQTLLDVFFSPLVNLFTVTLQVFCGPQFSGR